MMSALQHAIDVEQEFQEMAGNPRRQIALIPLARQRHDEQTWQAEREPLPQTYQYGQPLRIVGNFTLQQIDSRMPAAFWFWSGTAGKAWIVVWSVYNAAPQPQLVDTWMVEGAGDVEWPVMPAWAK